MRLVRIIDRYVFVEALGLYLLGFFGFVGFLLVNKLFLEAEQILNPQLPGWAIVKITLLDAPTQMLRSFPIGVLFATLMSMGRLAKDNELTAMFTNGISLYRLFLPYLLLASLNVGFAYVTQEYLMTLASQQQQRIYDANPIIVKHGEADPFITKLPVGDFVTASFFDKNTGALANVVYDDWSREGGGKTLVLSPAGQVDGNNLVLGGQTDAPAYFYDQEPDTKLYQGHTREPSQRFNLGLDLKQQYTAIKTPQELTQTELAEQSQVKRQRGENPAVDDTDYNFRFSGPFASLAFALVAMPLSLRAPRDERLLGLILSFILVLIYYTIFFISQQMGYAERLTPWLAAWMMNIVFAAISLIIFITSRK